MDVLDDAHHLITHTHTHTHKIHKSLNTSLGLYSLMQSAQNVMHLLISTPSIYSLRSRAYVDGSSLVSLLIAPVHTRSSPIL